MHVKKRSSQSLPVIMKEDNDRGHRAQKAKTNADCTPGTERVSEPAQTPVDRLIEPTSVTRRIKQLCSPIEIPGLFLLYPLSCVLATFGIATAPGWGIRCVGDEWVGMGRQR